MECCWQPCDIECGRLYVNTQIFCTLEVVNMTTLQIFEIISVKFHVVQIATNGNSMKERILHHIIIDLYVCCVHSKLSKIQLCV